MLGLDYSQGQPSGAAVKAAGYGFIAGYLDNGIPGRTNLAAATTADMRGAGVDVVVVWETTATRATAGRDAGVADAKDADAAATAADVAGHVIYFVVDFDLPDYAPASTDPRAKLGPVAAYFDGVVSVLGLPRTGGYGGYWAVKRLFDAGLITYGWQTVAWSGGQVDPRIHLLQRLGTVVVDGVECDEDEARKPDFGQNGVTMDWNDEISPDGMVDANGKQVTDAAKNFIGYADKFVQDTKAISTSNSAKLDALLAAVGAEATAEQQRDAELLAAVKSSVLASVDPKQVAAALEAGGLPQAVISSLLALLTKAAAA